MDGAAHEGAAAALPVGQRGDRFALGFLGGCNFGSFSNRIPQATVRPCVTEEVPGIAPVRQRHSRKFMEAMDILPPSG